MTHVNSNYDLSDDSLCIVYELRIVLLSINNDVLTTLRSSLNCVTVYIISTHKEAQQ
jgi:hypothetical protein